MASPLPSYNWLKVNWPKGGKEGTFRTPLCHGPIMTINSSGVFCVLCPESPWSLPSPHPFPLLSSLAVPLILPTCPQHGLITKSLCPASLVSCHGQDRLLFQGNGNSCLNSSLPKSLFSSSGGMAWKASFVGAKTV